MESIELEEVEEEWLVYVKLGIDVHFFSDLADEVWFI